MPNQTHQLIHHEFLFTSSDKVSKPLTEERIYEAPSFCPKVGSRVSQLKRSTISLPSCLI